MEGAPPPDFAEFIDNVGVPLRQALMAAYGGDVGTEATAEAISYARENWPDVTSGGYSLGDLYRVGQRTSRWYWRRPLNLPEVPDAALSWVGSSLPGVLRKLPRSERVAVILAHGHRWTYAQIGELLGEPPSTVQDRISRALVILNGAQDAGEYASKRAIADQIAAYSEILDSSGPPLADLVVDGAVSPKYRRRRPVVALIASTAAVFAVVGGLAAVSRSPATSVPPASTAASPVTVSVPDVVLTLENPRAVTSATFDEWPHRFAGPGAVAVVDGSFHMLSAAYDNGVATVAYATSDDGIVWTQGATQPVIDLSEAPWAPFAFDSALPRTVVIDSEGTWQLFFDISFFDANANEQRSSIGRVVARDPAGAWIFDAEPVVRPDASVPWMSSEVGSPSVVALEGGLVMLFVGNGSGAGVVGLAQSTDGATWEVRPGPVFAASGDWERGSIAQVDLIATSAGLAMLYTGDTPSRRGLAVSANGLEWAPHPDNPLLTGVHVPRGSVFDSEFVLAGTALLAYIENGSARFDREVTVLRVDLGIDLDELVLRLTGG